MELGERERRGDLIYNSQLACWAHLTVSPVAWLTVKAGCTQRPPWTDEAGSPLWLEGKAREIPGLFDQIAWAPVLYKHGSVPLLTGGFTGLLLKAAPTKRDVSIPNR